MQLLERTPRNHTLRWSINDGKIRRELDEKGPKGTTRNCASHRWINDRYPSWNGLRGRIRNLAPPSRAKLVTEKFRPPQQHSSVDLSGLNQKKPSQAPRYYINDGKSVGCFMVAGTYRTPQHNDRLEIIKSMTEKSVGCGALLGHTERCPTQPWPILMTEESVEYAIMQEHTP